jgi:hypothetical protein
MLSQWLWIHVCYSEPNSCESCCIILSRLWFSYGVSCRAIGYEWYEPMVVNYDVLWWSSGCESWCVMLRKWLWIMMCNAEQVVASHGELCWTSGFESWCAMLSQWLWIMVRYAEPVVVNHVVLYWADCVLVMVCHADPLVMTDISQWLWIMTCYGGPVVVSHGL